MSVHVAIDLGASSGRVISGEVSNDVVRTRLIRRFSNAPVVVPTQDADHLHWDVLNLWDNSLRGLADLQAEGIDSVGVDTWAVDYGLLGASGELLGNPFSYRDWRTDGIPDAFFERADRDEVYRLNGVQVQSFNTMFQLLAAARDGSQRSSLKSASSLLMLPDLFNYWLTGQRHTEATNGSSTGLLDPGTRQWSDGICGLVEERGGVAVARLLAPLIEPGSIVGSVRQGLVPTWDGTSETPVVVAVGSHDTASAVAGVPAREKNWAYISCGTWSLVGLELARPVLTSSSRELNFTNELGVDGTVRFLKNIMGMWVLNSCFNRWKKCNPQLTWKELDREAARCSPLRTVIDINHPSLFTPGDMPSRIARLARATGQPVPESPGQFVRTINESLALAHAQAVRQACTLAERSVDEIHLVGGAVNNAQLCQFTADASGLPVVAGPQEATSLGNLMVQARAVGDAPADLSGLRRIIRNSVQLTTYRPDGNQARWAEAATRIYNEEQE